MNFTIQSSLKFKDWEEKTGRHKKLICILSVLEMAELCEAFKTIRDGKTKGFRDEVLFRCVLGFMVFNCRKVTEGIRILDEDKVLRDIVGLGAWGKIPSKHCFYRFIKKLTKELCQKALGKMFSKLVEELKENLPGFGTHLVGDSTKTHSYASGRKLSVDEEASWKKQKKKGKDMFGNIVTSFEKWFGYKAHFLVDADYELPVAFVTTTARYNDNTVFPQLWDKAKKENSWIKEKTQYMGLDMGYDDGKIYKQLAVEDNIIPIIKMRDMVAGENKCIDLSSAVVCENNLALKFNGYERERKQIRYTSPKECTKTRCTFYKNCSIKVKRISIIEDPRKLLPIPRNTHKFRRLNNKRVSVERVNSRLKEHYNLDGLRRYGLKQNNLMVNLSVLCMNAFALYIARKGHIEEVRRIHYALAA